MGDVEYFISVVTLGEAARLVEYVEQVDTWTSETPPALKQQVRIWESPVQYAEFRSEDARVPTCAGEEVCS